MDVVVLWCVFFFQAEDGIRYLVRSRGLGDVYKRQSQRIGQGRDNVREFLKTNPDIADAIEKQVRGAKAVSYTHLTLPTSDLV